MHFFPENVISLCYQEDKTNLKKKKLQKDALFSFGRNFVPLRHSSQFCVVFKERLAFSNILRSSRLSHIFIYYSNFSKDRQIVKFLIIGHFRKTVGRLHVLNMMI